MKTHRKILSTHPKTQVKIHPFPSTWNLGERYRPDLSQPRRWLQFVEEYLVHPLPPLHGRWRGVDRVEVVEKVRCWPSFLFLPSWASKNKPRDFAQSPSPPNCACASLLLATSDRSNREAGLPETHMKPVFGKWMIRVWEDCLFRY